MGRKHNPVTDATYYARNRTKIRKLQRAYYQRCHKFILAQETKRREARVLKIRELKDKPCVDCGGRFHFSAMQFDHVRGTKSFNISRASRSVKNLMLEAEKCEVVCANCHAVRTYKRRHGEL